jgi:hypothetical protein
VWRAAVPRTPQSLETRVSRRVTVDLDEILARVEAREACWPPT